MECQTSHKESLQSGTTAADRWASTTSHLLAYRQSSLREIRMEHLHASIAQTSEEMQLQRANPC